MQVNSHKMHFKFLSVAAGDFIFVIYILRLYSLLNLSGNKSIKKNF